MPFLCINPANLRYQSIQPKQTPFLYLLRVCQLRWKITTFNMEKLNCDREKDFWKSPSLKTQFWKECHLFDQHMDYRTTFPSSNRHKWNSRQGSNSCSSCLDKNWAFIQRIRLSSCFIKRRDKIIPYAQYYRKPHLFEPKRETLTSNKSRTSAVRLSFRADMAIVWSDWRNEGENY